VWRRWVPLAAVVALLGAAMLAALYANPSIPALTIERGPARTPPSRGPVRDDRTVEPPGTPGPAEANLPPWVGTVLTYLCIGVIVAVAGALLWMLLRDRLVQRRTKLPTARPPTIAQTQQSVRAAVDVGLADLDDTDADPRRAVIACWVRLETAAATAGTAREPGDTSTDLVARLLAAHMISADVLAGFAAVYREARFATHTVDETMRDQARSALRLLRDELMAGSLEGGP
jgi:hypothetical protein